MNTAFLPSWAGWRPDAAASFTSSFRARQQPIISSRCKVEQHILFDLRDELRKILPHGHHKPAADPQQISALLYQAGSVVLAHPGKVWRMS